MTPATLACAIGKGLAAEVAIDVWHHVVYAAAAGVTYELLQR